MLNSRYSRDDYSVVVKHKEGAPKPWGWEIYRAGTANPIKVPSDYFDTLIAAQRAGKQALKELMDKLFS
jgi:hypothetical protein